MIDEAKERKVAWALMVLGPLSMAIIFTYVTLGYAKGIEAGHPKIYLQMTCVMWAFVSLILPTLRLKRAISLPYWFLAMIYIDIQFYVISLCHGMYFTLAWWGDFTHVVSATVIALIVFLALCLMQAHSPAYVSFGSKGGMVFVLFLIICGFGIIWEVMEGCVDIITGQDYMVYGVVDTLYDLLADLIGAVIASVGIWFLLGKRDIGQIASMIRIGRNNIDTDR